MTEPILKIEISDSVATLTMNRPDKRNAMCDELLAAIDGFFLAPPAEVKAVVITGTAGHFCSGLDLSEHVARDAEGTMRHSRGWHQVMDRIQFSGLPVVSAMFGAVIGGAPRGTGVFAPRSIVAGSVEEVGAVSDEIRFGARVDVQLLLPVAIHIVTRGTTVSSLAGVNGAVVARCENRSARERVPPGIAGIPEHPTGQVHGGPASIADGDGFVGDVAVAARDAQRQGGIGLLNRPAQLRIPHPSAVGLGAFDNGPV